MDNRTLEKLDAWTTQERQALSALVNKHRVTFEVSPIADARGSERIHSGYDLDLIGAFGGAGKGRPFAGADRWAAVWQDLYRLAAAAARNGDGSQLWLRDVRSFDHALHTSTRRSAGQGGPLDEVRLTIRIRPKAGRGGAGKQEEQVLKQIIQTLRALGVHEPRE